MHCRKEKDMGQHSVARTLIALAAVALAASSAVGAERTVIVEHFTATW